MNTIGHMSRVFKVHLTFHMTTGKHVFTFIRRIIAHIYATQFFLFTIEFHTGMECFQTDHVKGHKMLHMSKYSSSS